MWPYPRKVRIVASRRTGLGPASILRIRLLAPAPVPRLGGGRCRRPVGDRKRDRRERQMGGVDSGCRGRRLPAQPFGDSDRCAQRPQAGDLRASNARHRGRGRRRPARLIAGSGAADHGARWRIAGADRLRLTTPANLDRVARGAFVNCPRSPRGSPSRWRNSRRRLASPHERPAVRGGARYPAARPLPTG